MINLPESDKSRIVIVGGGFAGLTMARKLTGAGYDIALIDKHNYHQFQPLFYQVAMSGLEPSSIVFPFRKHFQREKNVFIRVAKVEGIHPDEKFLDTSEGRVNYDFLVLALGADTNYYGNEEIARHAIPMKSVSEALFLRNRILSDYEKAIMLRDYKERQPRIDIVIAGGGPTGVEVAGALAEMRKYIIPKDYPDLKAEEIDITLVEGMDRLLGGMSDKSATTAKTYLEELGVQVKLGVFVDRYDGKRVTLSDGTEMEAFKLIWAAGVACPVLEGTPEESLVKGGRLRVDRQLRVQGMQDVFAIGDQAYMEEPDFPKGHPQVAQVALQQGKYLAEYFKNQLDGKETPPFHYKDLGSMATIGRKKAVVDLPKFHFKGTFAWLVWLFVHLFQILGVRNRLIIFINWLWNYLTYDQALRLIIRPKVKSEEPLEV